MIQINLLPDVKQEYLKARRTRNFVISVAIITGMASVGLVVLLLIFMGTLTAVELRADGRIKDEYQTLSEVDSLSDLVTIQNQLSLINTQHQSKSMGSRLFGVLQAVNPPAPNSVSFNSVRISPEEGTLHLEGSATGGYRAIETLTKTITNTKIEYIRDQESVTEPISKKVNVGETSYGEDADGRRVVRFELTIEYNEVLFSNQAGSMRVEGPNRRIDVTDSKLRVPNSLFTAKPTDEEEKD